MSDNADKGMWWKAKARFPFNAKVMALSDAAFRLHVSTSCWCCDELNDGKFKANVPAGMPKAPRGKKLTDALEELVVAGLWRSTTEGYEINDFLKYNMSRAQYEAMVAAGREGGKRSGEARRAKKNEPPPSGVPSAPPRPGPTPLPRPAPQHDHDHEERSKNPPPKDLTRSAPGQATTAAAAGLEFVNRGDAAVLILEDESLASALKPHTWPELLGLVRLACETTGLEQRVLPYDADPTVRAFVALLAAYDLDRLRAVFPRVLASDWWREKPGRPLSHLSRPVIDRALAEDAELARVEASRQQTRQRSVVPRKATPQPAGLSLAETMASIQRAEQALG